MDIYAKFIDRNASEEKFIKVSKQVGIVFAVLTTIVGPLIYFFPVVFKIFLYSLVMLNDRIQRLLLQIPSEVRAKVILVLHMVCYSSNFDLCHGSMHRILISRRWYIELSAAVEKALYAKISTGICTLSRFLFVESRVFSSFTPCGAAGAPRLPARYCGQRGLSGGWQG